MDAKERPVQKPPKEDTQPTLVEADKLTYDDTNKMVTAEGHVEITHGNQILQADKVVYDEKTSLVHAKGHISLLQGSGDVIFADEADLTSDIKDAFVHKVGMLFKDNSRLVAEQADRYEGRYLITKHGIYTACELCKDDPTKPPFWQFKASRVTHDNLEKEVIYRDAFLEFWGVPVFYMPYFAHPDPSVTRRQGFLNPTMGYTETLGSYVRTPYYFDLAPNTDLVLTPIISQTDKLQLGGEVRHRFANGDMKWSGSTTHTDLTSAAGNNQGRQWRGNIFGTTHFNLNDEWRLGSDIAYTTDKSYLLRYNISDEDVLLNRAFLEGFRGRNYAVANTYYFEDLRPSSQQKEPLVLPDASFSALGEPNKTLGGRWSLDGNLMVTTRSRDSSIEYQGPDTRRLATKAGWERQLVSSTGFLTNVSAFARMDGYWAEHIPTTANDTTTFSDTLQVRQFAQTDITTRYPLGRRGDGYEQILEPIAVFTAAPVTGSSTTLPNEDSLDVEFDETNLFMPSRFSGIDRLEGGTRVAYGLRQSLIGDNGAKIETVGGQIFRIERDKDLPEDSGLQDTFSDYVGRIDFTPSKWLDTSYRFRLDRENFEFQRQEAQGSFGVPVFRPFFNYLLANQYDSTTAADETVEEITAGFNSKFAEFWKLFASYKYGFRPDPGPRQIVGGLNYQDECFATGLSVTRDETNRQDVQSGTTVMFHFYLKNIGGIHTDSGLQDAFATPHLNSESQMSSEPKMTSVLTQ